MSADAPTPSPPGWVWSVVALALGVVLSVAVSALFATLGWGGELASQTAGASSGAAPLILDAARQRRVRRSAATTDLGRPARDRPRRLLVVGGFAFALLLLESAWGWFVYHLARWSVRAAHAGPDRFQAVYTLQGGLLVLPVVLATAYLLALAAGRRLREHRRRWILLGMAVYALVRLLQLVVVLTRPRTDDLTTATGPVLVAGFLVTVPVLCGVALLGVRRARRTQAAYDASVFFRHLEESDREAALALLHDAQRPRGR